MTNKNRAKIWLSSNPEAKKILNEYIGDEDYWLCDLKDGGKGQSFPRLLIELRETNGSSEWFKQLEQDKELGKAVWRFILG